MEIQELEHRRNALAQDIAGCSEFRIGSLFHRHRRCGKTGCRCNEPNDPGHGCWVVVKRRAKQTVMSTVPEGAVSAVREKLAEGQRFWRLCAEFAEANDELAKARLRGEAGTPVTAKKGASAKSLRKKSPARSKHWLVRKPSRV